MPRLTLSNCIQSRLPECIGVCQDNTPAIATAVNSSQERLVYAPEAGDEGWYGSFAEMVFNVLQSDPYIALGRYGARIMEAAVCNSVIQVNNQFYEYLRFGNGKKPRLSCVQGSNNICGHIQAYARGVFPAWRNLTAGHKIRVRALDSLDVSGNKRTLIQGTDYTGQIISSLDGATRVQGEYLNIVSPFVDMPVAMNTLTGIQKDPTNGPVQYYDLDPDTGDETLILTMEAGETVAGYPRYYLDRMPLSCCPVIDVNGSPTVQVTALVKLNLIPVYVPTDYLLIQSLEAIIAECQSARYSTMDIPSSKQMAALAHKDAVRLLRGELNHYYGTENPAVSFEPFGSARLERQGIGLLV